MPRCLVPSKTLRGSKDRVTSEEERHDVVMAAAQCVVAKDTTSAGELAEETDDTRSPAARRVKSLPRRKEMTPNYQTDDTRSRPADCGMPVAGYMVISGRRRSRRHRRVCLGADGVPGIFPRQAVENNALFSQPREDWLYGEVDAFDSTKFDQACERVRLLRPWREACCDQER